jgi:hypothetical protein
MITQARQALSIDPFSGIIEKVFSRNQKQK